MARQLLLAVLASQLLLGGLGALVSIDLGSEFLKVALIKPGRIPIAIVANEMSKRKTPALVGIVGGERLMGEEAASVTARFPEAIIARARDLLGKTMDDPTVASMIKQQYLPYQVVEHPTRKVAAIKVGDDVHSPEDIVVRSGPIAHAPHLIRCRSHQPSTRGGVSCHRGAPDPSPPSHHPRPLHPAPPSTSSRAQGSLFQYARSIAEAQAGTSVVDAVLTVPAYFSQFQRQALVSSASLAGLSVMGLINSHSAAALQYGIERDFVNASQTVILYDMGSSGVQVALVRCAALLLQRCCNAAASACPGTRW
jgi:hypoxia up-regulated 1